MLATALIKRLETLISAYGNFPVEVELDPPGGIARLRRVRFEESDSARGCTIILVGEGDRV